jgi:probable HAF family extracellular repeat protein
MQYVHAQKALKAGARAIALALLMTTTAYSGDKRDREVLYEITHLEALGTASRGSSINDRGWVAGFTTFGSTRHATLWKGFHAEDLGAIGGANTNSNVVWDGLNNRGLVAGISQTAMAEPRGEDWSCSAFFPAATATGRVCVGFAWERGDFMPLPVFPGGTNGFATGVNDSGEIVGWAENGVEDDTCNDPQVLQFRAALWEERGRRINIAELPPLGDDETSAATAINERGDVVGISGACADAVGGFSAKHSVLWRKGKPTRIDDFGGISWNTPMAINIHGEVVGFANPPGDVDGQYNATAFYWNEDDGIANLKTLPGNTNSQAHGINTRGQVVGISFGGTGGSRAFIWEGEGPIVNLNSRVVPGYKGTLTDARDINERGEITGAAIDENGKTVAFIARPERKRW